MNYSLRSWLKLLALDAAQTIGCTTVTASTRVQQFGHKEIMCSPEKNMTTFAIYISYNLSVKLNLVFRILTREISKKATTTAAAKKCE